MTAYVSVIASLAALVSWMAMSSESMIRFVRENGPIENLTLVVYIVAIALILYSGRTVLTVKTRAAIVILLAYMFMREADLHKSLSGTSILKIKFWLGSQFPVTDKLIALAILLPVLWALFYFIRGYTRRWWSDLCLKDSYAVGIEYRSGRFAEIREKTFRRSRSRHSHRFRGGRGGSCVRGVHAYKVS